MGRNPIYTFSCVGLLIHNLMVYTKQGTEFLSLYWVLLLRKASQSTLSMFLLDISISLSKSVSDGRPCNTAVETGRWITSVDDIVHPWVNPCRWGERERSPRAVHVELRFVMCSCSSPSATWLPEQGCAVCTWPQVNRADRDGLKREQCFFEVCVRVCVCVYMHFTQSPCMS